MINLIQQIQLVIVFIGIQHVKIINVMKLSMVEVVILLMNFATLCKIMLKITPKNTGKVETSDEDAEI